VDSHSQRNGNSFGTNRLLPLVKWNGTGQVEVALEAWEVVLAVLGPLPS